MCLMYIDLIWTLLIERGFFSGGSNSLVKRIRSPHIK